MLVAKNSVFLFTKNSGLLFTDYKTPAQLSRAFINVPYQGKKFTHYVAIDVTGLDVKKGRDGVFVIPNTDDLDLRNRIVGSGQVQNSTPASQTQNR